MQRSKLFHLPTTFRFDPHSAANNGSFLKGSSPKSWRLSINFSESEEEESNISDNSEQLSAQAKKLGTKHKFW